jgi:hypothetical protein
MAKTTIPAGYFAAGSIATADLADDAITSAKIADNAITAAMIPNATALTLDGGLTVDNITINGTEIDLSSGDLTVDVAGNLILAPGTDEVRLVGGSNDTAFGKFYASSGNFYINMPTQDKDIIFSGNDGGASITAMTIDMSEGGRVGIGTASPSELLHLTASSGHARLRTDNGTVTTFSGADSANSMLIGTSTNHAVRFVTNDSEIARFDTSGNLGIGTTSPEEALHVSGNMVLDRAAPRLFFQTGSTHYNWKVAAQDSTNKAFEIASGEVDADANSDTYTPRFVIAGDTGTVDNPNGDITADNIYAGASGLQTELVSFPCTSTYPNNSTYTLTLTAAQAPLGSRVIMGIWISSGNSGGDQYCYLVQGQAHGPRLMQHVDSWYYNDGAMSMFKIDNAADRDFNVTHGTIVATNSNDFRKIYYYGYIMDN